MSKATAWPASDRQVAFLTTLWNERQHDYTDFPESLTGRQASSYIDELMACPRRPRPASIQEPGYFRKGEDIVKAQPSRNGGLYGKVLVVIGDKGRWDYRPGLLSGVTEADRLSLEDAKAFGRTHGFCIACGALLTDPESIANGIGPVCATRF